MLDWPGVLPDIPDKEGQTPLWHALDSVGKEYDVFFFSGLDFSNNDHSVNSWGRVWRFSVRAMVWTPLQPTAFAKTPLGFDSWSGLDSQLGQDPRLCGTQ